MNDKLWKVNDVASYLKCSKGHIYNLVSKKKIPFIKFGGLLFFSPLEIDNFLLSGAKYV